jgi:hypothetical protein
MRPHPNPSRTPRGQELFAGQCHPLVIGSRSTSSTGGNDENSETARTWATAVAPLAERAARILWSTTTKRVHRPYPPTRLTQDHRRRGRGSASGLQDQRGPKHPRICRGGVAKALRDPFTLVEPEFRTGCPSPETLIPYPVFPIDILYVSTYCSYRMPIGDTL